ncbi:hypothetical protein [Sphingomonas carotinifaciens]|uniref:Uncharacterized protein n=1 Tax=Sphingomonas carotinifaciens TaxID=1166323 RepID=A0A1G7LCA9_9SPHN|nr:hypothetical protein [Sphingomonas carotinifaciens]MBB4085598.1 hypothetical protein [Sphingomonas carotinifaciens]MWC43381.1 hypothetical protein [Sphingomonas carotinifaciens]SDF46934.1 hypothetical protein SAMN05216557_103444 [Sphingomonas carotinifaciens]
MTDRDIPPEAGKRPPFAKPEPPLDAIGTGKGYSGQEYDSAGQAEWRAGQDAQAVAPEGIVRGSGTAAGGGAPGEDYDPNTPGAADESPQAGAGPDRRPT